MIQVATNKNTTSECPIECPGFFVEHGVSDKCEHFRQHGICDLFATFCDEPKVITAYESHNFNP